MPTGILLIACYCSLFVTPEENSRFSDIFRGVWKDISRMKYNFAMFSFYRLGLPHIWHNIRIHCWSISMETFQKIKIKLLKVLWTINFISSYHYVWRSNFNLDKVNRIWYLLHQIILSRVNTLGSCRTSYLKSFLPGLGSKDKNSK